MKKIRVGINGFGRIGRIAARIIMQRDDLELVAINSRSDATSHAYLLKYDTNYGTLNNDIRAQGDDLTVDGRKIVIFKADDISEIPWNRASVDIVIEATGKYRKKEELAKHIQQGAKYVVLSAPAKDDTKTIVMGVNEESFDPKQDKFISNSSCTTNCLATTLKVLHDNFKVIRGFMTTTHAVTDSQNIADNSHKKEIRLRRAAFASMIPADTGSAKDIGKLFPDLEGKVICQAIRVPLLTVSLINLTVEVVKNTSVTEVNSAFTRDSMEDLRGILSVTTDQLVSKDFTGNPHSAVVDTFLTQITGENLVNIFAWYDNEWGYTERLVEMVSFVGKKAGI